MFFLIATQDKTICVTLEQTSESEHPLPYIDRYNIHWNHAQGRYHKTGKPETCVQTTTEKSPAHIIIILCWWL